MNTLQITLPDEATDKSLPKLGELAFLYPTDNKGFSVAAGTNNTGKVRAENCQLTRTYPTPQVGPASELTYVGSSMAVMPSSVVADNSYVFLGDKYDLTILQFGNHTAAVDLVHGDLSETKLANLNATWLKYKGGSYPIDKLPWSTLTTLEYNSDSERGKPSTMTGDFADCDVSNIGIVKLNNKQIYGNLEEDFVNASNLTELRLAANQLLTGNISGLGNLTSLTVLTLNTCKNVSGTLESLLDAMVANGRTSGSMTISLLESSITYNGSVPVSTLTATFSGGSWVVS